MSDAYVIQSAGETAGIVVRARGGFQFFASLPALAGLEGRTFAGLGEVHRAIARIEDEAASRSRRDLPAWARRPRASGTGREAA